MNERFVIFSGSERTGEVEVTDDDERMHVTYGVFNNGRGARLDERLRVNADFIPLEWTVTGTSLMGGQVQEKLTTDGTNQSWAGQSDEGTDTGPRLKLYLAADCGPIASWIYARAALATGGTVAALPSGSVHTRLFMSVELGDVYVLTGASLTPQYLLMDAGLRLIALWSGGLDHVGSEILIREEYADDRVAVIELLSSLDLRYLEQIQQRVRHRRDAPVRIRDVRVFDPHTRDLTTPVSVTVFRGRITAVEPESGTVAALGETVIDGGGGTLVAGLHDMHAHVTPWAGPFYLAAGVTTVRDMGNDNASLLDLVPRLDTGDLAGPTVVLSGLIEGRSEYSMRLGVIPDTLDDALETVRWYGARGYHQIKIYNSMNPDWVKPLAAEAHRIGMRVVGHVPAFSTPDRVIEDGYDEVTHINQLMLGWLLEDGEDTRTPLRLTAMARAKGLDLASPAVARTVELMRDNHVGLDTTAGILERLMLSRARSVHASDAPYLSHMPVGYQRSRKRAYVPYSTEADLDSYSESFDMLLNVLKMLHANGIDLWPGTDDGTGFTVHRELELYVMAGLAPADVLRIATYRCAQHLGLGHTHGSVERGKVASFVLIDGDPTADISAIRNVGMVVKDGDMYFPHEIYQELGVEPFAAPPRQLDH